MNLRERKKERTRESLADAALELFLSRGYDGTTVEDIVATAGVSRRTFFRYFPSKEAVFFTNTDDRFEVFEAYVEAHRAEVGMWRAVGDGLLALVGTYERDRPAALAWRRVLMSSDVLVAHDLRRDARWEARIAEFLRDDGASPYRAAIRAGAVMGVVRAVLTSWYDADAQGDLGAMGREGLAWLDEGLCPPGQAPRTP